MVGKLNDDLKGILSPCTLASEGLLEIEIGLRVCVCCVCVFVRVCVVCE